MNIIRYRRRGSVYVAVLGWSMLVMVIAMGGLLAVRVASRQLAEANNMAEAQACSRAALEQGRLAIQNDPSWRTNLTNNTWSAPISFAGGTLRWKVVDEADGNLANNDLDSVRLYGEGVVRGTTRVTSVILVAKAVPYEVFQASLHSAGAVSLPSATYNASPVVLTTTGGPLSTAATLTNAGAITGDVDALSYTGTGTVSGTTKTGVAAKTMPPATVFNDYLAASNPPKTIPWNNTYFPSGVSSFNVITPTLATPNAITYQSDGLYYIQVPASTTLKIDTCRLNCTLLIDAGAGSTVHIGAQILWTPARPDYPLAIIRGATNVELDARGAGGLSEASTAKNFNPAGFPYNGVSNATNTDTYNAYLNGVVHVIGGACTTKLFPQLSTNGCIICEGPVTYPGGGGAAPSASLAVDPVIAASPPRGYYTVKMSPSTGSWRRELAG